MNLERWFPLVPRPRPPGHRLTDRVDTIAQDAALAREGTGQEALDAASRVYNGAALIASDTGQQELARTWCWKHAEHYLAHLPLSGTMAQRALEPVVNLARLRIRAGDGGQAFAMLAALHEGVRTGQAIVLDGRTLPLDRITATKSDHDELHQWVWTILLGDGLRALTSAGRWDEAAEQAQRHGGVGDRLFDGRQTVVIAHLLSGRAEHALALIERSTVQEPWEQALRAVLNLWCRTELSDQTSLEVDDLRGSVSKAFDVSRPLFSARLGLAALHLLHRVGAETADLTSSVAEVVLRTEDGYAARDLLNSWETTDTQKQDLSRVLRASGLAEPELLGCLHQRLTKAVTTASGRLDSAFPATTTTAHRSE
ncbi:hypothetical protein NE857_26295 [Nocardiopsis exhalans]|uniref:Uncharacterized protein n=2 Tax=Nocardiopsis TaxID=2013 RepID=A0A840W5Q7_9ACTN|nr:MULTISPECIES: hypothetical protein [Nocardiopsis]MBB5492310.1 hypothetical protein [Nocardiopsis metallicus]USY18763.1 hypothetical protein NE857_26295 [Nocardiopsis exhalans]